MNLSAPFIERPVATTLLTLGVALAGAIAFPLLPVSPLPQVDYPDDLGAGVAARREPGDDGGDGRDAARALARPHRRRHRDDVVELARLDAHHAAVRPLPRHRRRRARRAGGDQRRARAAADRAAEQSDLPQGESGRRADHDPGAHVGHDDAGPDVRRRIDDHRAEAVAGRRRRPGERRRQLAAGGARRAQSAGAQQVRHRVRGRAQPRSRRPTPTGRRARSRTATGTGRSTPTTRRRPRPNTCR